MPEHTTGATDDVQTSTPDRDDQSAGQPSWAGAMAQIDAEIAELQAMLAKRRIDAAAEDTDEEPDSAA